MGRGGGHGGSRGVAGRGSRCHGTRDGHRSCAPSQSMGIGKAGIKTSSSRLHSTNNTKAGGARSGHMQKHMHLSTPARHMKFKDARNVNPNEIRFSQNTIGTHFRNGKSVDSLVTQLKQGKVKPKDIQTIRAYETKQGNLFTHDNRRLEAFQKAGVSEVPVNITSKHVPDFKFTQHGGGHSVKRREKKVRFASDRQHKDKSNRRRDAVQSGPRKKGKRCVHIKIVSHLRIAVS